jgi:hypothetical protein
MGKTKGTHVISAVKMLRGGGECVWTVSWSS